MGMLVSTGRNLRKVLIVLLGAIAIMPFLLVSCLFAGRALLSSQDYTLDGAAEAHFVPAAGNEIYCRGTGLYRVFEFKVSEEGFKTWADELGVSLTEIGNEFEISRYLWAETPYPSARDADLQAHESKVRAAIHSGLRGERRASNGGGYTIAYDRERSTAYAQWSHH